MYRFTHRLRAGHTVGHPSFAKAGLPKQAIIIEVLPSKIAELDNGLFLPLSSLERIETGEIWTAIAGYPHCYLLSSHGKAVSLLYHRTGRERLLKILSPTTFPAVSLCNGSGPKQVGLARLVAQHFLPAPPDMQLVRAVHKDGNNLNVKADNLQWTNPADVEDAFVQHHLHRHGERHGRSKLTQEDVARIRELAAAGLSKQQIANEFDVSRPAKSQIVSGISRRYA